MTTKEQERKALAKIRKIVDELGEDSYIATAFDGVWEIAEENIGNDFANSVRFYINKYYESERKLACRNTEAMNKVDELMKENRELTAEVEYQKSEVEFTKKGLADKNTDYVNACNRVDEVSKALRAEQEKTAALEHDVMKLKAKLFDLMYKEA